MKLLSHIGRYLQMLGGMFAKPENMRVYGKEFFHQCNEIGIVVF
jgi:phospholipid/cholesterol/gamma-HCH transport system permease protein